MILPQREALTSQTSWSYFTSFNIFIHDLMWELRRSQSSEKQTTSLSWHKIRHHAREESAPASAWINARLKTAALMISNVLQRSLLAGRGRRRERRGGEEKSLMIGPSRQPFFDCRQDGSRISGTFGCHRCIRATNGDVDLIRWPAVLRSSLHSICPSPSGFGCSVGAFLFMYFSCCPCSSACSTRSFSCISRAVLAVLTTRLTDSVDHPLAENTLAVATLVITIAGPLRTDTLDCRRISSRSPCALTLRVS